MSLLMNLPRILEESRAAFARLAEAPVETRYVLREDRRGGDAPGNCLVRGENAAYMHYLLQNRGMAGRLQLIYADPPFFSHNDYGADLKLRSAKLGALPAVRRPAYEDLWTGGMEDYLSMLTLRFLLMRELLSEEGCLWVHLDWHAVHAVKLLLDEIFGTENFVHEVIWQYKSGGAGKRRFARKHDTLLFYAKSKKYYFKALQEKSYNRNYRPYRFKGVKEYKDDLGWYTMVNCKDVWQMDMVGRTAAERSGYATQKPEVLLRRILESCSREGDLCADLFGGSGTLAAVAEDMGRAWISCDAGGLAAACSLNLLGARGSRFSCYEEAEHPAPHVQLRSCVRR
jgi:adenine specific DNA methylase Mod